MRERSGIYILGEGELEGQYWDPSEIILDSYGSDIGSMYSSNKMEKTMTDF